MSIFFDTSSFFQSSGNAAAEFPEQLRDGIVTSACSLWASYPDFVTKGTSPAASFARGYMNSVCSPIQSPVPAPTIPFTGGQCEGIAYNISVDIELTDNNGSVSTVQTGTTAIGQISQIEIVTPTTGSDQRPRFVVTDAEPGSPRTRVISIFGNPTVSATLSSISVSRVDGQPDNCGNLPVQYPPTSPTQNDLTYNITVNNLDGVQNNYTLEYNQTDLSYNFPLVFRINGSPVTLDLSGLTIYGNTNVSNFNTGNESPPPGSEPGRDVNGDPINTPSNQSDYPTINAPDVVETVASAIEYVICEEGVLETVTETVKLIPGVSPIITVILDILSGLTEELCEAEEKELGFPEVYPVLPGVERPAIVFYWKEVVDGKKLPSTYTSTVSNPSTDAINAINSISVPDKIMGKYVISVRLNDGSRIVSSGSTEANANASFAFLLGQVDPAFIPEFLNDIKATTVREVLEEREVKCSQIEYYPLGKQSAVNPEIVRFIDILE